MRLTPLDIKKQEFKRILRGFDPLEVETFLEMVANEYEGLLKEVETLRMENQTLATQLKDFQQVEQTLKETLVNAQESINRARANTEKEANLIVHEAELRAEKLMDGARREVDRLKNELVVLRSQKESLATRLRHLLQSQIELIEVLQSEDSNSRDPDQELVVKSFEKTEEKPAKAIQEELPLPAEPVEPDPEDLSETEKVSEPPDDEDQMVF